MARAVIMVATRGKSFRRVASTSQTPKIQPQTGEAGNCWAMLIKRVYEVDPLECPCCRGQMKIVSFIERCGGDVIEKILRHCGLWEGPQRTSLPSMAAAAAIVASRVNSA